MNTAAPLLGAVDGITPVALVEQGVQGVFVASDRIAVVQGQPRPLDRLGGLRDC